MRCFPLLLLALLATPASSLLPVVGAAQEARAEAGVPATVLLHELSVVLDSSGRMRETQTWQIRIDDPAACEAGLQGPPGLSGAMDAGAMVLDDLLVIPADTAPGTVFTLSASRSEHKGPYSGVFESAPDLPALEVRTTVSAPTWIPLTIWADDDAEPTYSRTRGRTATYVWYGRDTGQNAQMVWTTWKDWVEAGTHLSRFADNRVATKRQLGPVLAANISSLNIGEAISRVTTSIQLEEGSLDWADARHSVEVAQQGRGSAVERAVVLISLLREAGYDARPALYRPSSQLVAPTTVPAPSLLTRPAVAVVQPGRTVWIDPSNEHASVPQPPAAMVGGVAWQPGDLPVLVQANAMVDGTVVVLTEVKLAADGTATLSSSVQASGVAEEALRANLGSLDSEGRTDALRQLIAIGRPGLDRVALSARGLDSARNPVSLTVQAKDTSASTAFGPGIEATIAPLLAPALASWLPPNIRVREEVAISGPGSMRPVYMRRGQTSWNESASMGSAIKREADRYNLIVEVERPYRETTAARDSAAAAFLNEAAVVGPTLRYVPMPDAKVVKVFRKSEQFTAAQKTALEALLWIEAGYPAKATKPIKKAVAKQPFPDLLTAALENTGDDDGRVLELLWEHLPTDADRLVVAEAYARRGAADGWTKVAPLTMSDDPDVAVSAMLLQTILEPLERPEADPSGYWKPQDELLARVEVKAVKTNDARRFVGESLLRRAQRAAQAGQWDAAAGYVTSGERVLRNNAEYDVLSALVGAHGGMALQAVDDLIAEATAKDPGNADIFDIAALAHAQAGDDASALAAARTAARISVTDANRWAAVMSFALPAGDLPAALDAARRASDLTPQDAERASSLYLLAVLADAPKAKTIAERRGGSGPAAESLDDRMMITPEDSLLALLSFYDTEVTADPRLLGLRAQLRMESGDLDGATRDGTLLTHRLSDPRGYPIAFAATAGRSWSSSARDHLNTAARRNNNAKAVRMEYNLVTGAGDPLTDSNALRRDDPRAQTVSDAVYKPTKLASSLDGWPEGLQNPRWKAPSGFRTNRALSATRGVVAYSDSNTGCAVLKIAANPTVLPPPLAQLYTASEVPLLRNVDGTEVYRLYGGAIPLYVARVDLEGEQLLGLAHTANGALRALERARP